MRRREVIAGFGAMAWSPLAFAQQRRVYRLGLLGAGQTPTSDVPLWAAFAPTITTSNVFARQGLLMSYGSDLGSIWRLAAHYTDQLLRCAKAADLPVQVPTRYEFVLNLRTARAIGKEPPDTLLARADEVIE